MKMQSQLYRVMFGDSVTLVCEVTATPKITQVTWQREVKGQMINITTGTNVDKYSGSTVDTPSLTVNPVDLSDEGVYTCGASNMVGTGQRGRTSLNLIGG